MVLVFCTFSYEHLCIDVPCLISIPFVLSKIWPRHTSIMKKKWLWGDNTVNIQGMIMVIVHGPSSHWILSINQVSFQSLVYFPRYGQATIMKNG